MRRGLLIAVLAVLLGAHPVLAGSGPRIFLQPRMPQGQMRPPPAMRLPPSAAVSRALNLNPGGRVVGIKNMGNNYSVTIRMQNQVKRVIIPSQ